MNPFPGLRPFLEEEEHHFFGRETQVDAMVDKLAATHFLAVVGMSGSGKSSLVNCGLRPALHRGMMAGAGTSWRMAQFRPGNRPTKAMAAALARAGFSDEGAPEPFTPADIIEASLNMSSLGLLDVFEEARLGKDVNLLVVVDQFEELFRFNQTVSLPGDAPYELTEEALAFVNLLLEVRTPPFRNVYVVLTMRSDFLGECAQFHNLPEAINQGQYLVPRMTREERRRAIAGPAAVEGAEIDSVLLTRLVNDVGGNPDQLSILQHALNRTWARWKKDERGGPITLKHYEDIGTMAKALDQHAEKAYGELTTAREQQICAKLFKALTDKATDARGVRRPTTVDSLLCLTGATMEELTRVIDVFRKPSRSFLMPPANEALTAETMIDISHESLMRVWKRLRVWADEEAVSAATYRRLSETAIREAVGKSSLYQGADLDGALNWNAEEKPDIYWAERYAPGFRLAMQFLQKSADAQEAQRKREINEAVKAAQTEARYARSISWLFLALIIAIVCAGAFYRKSMNTEHAAEAARHEAEKKVLVAQAALRNQRLRAENVNLQMVAVQSFAVDSKPPNNNNLSQSFDALAHISAITTTRAPEHLSNVTIKYYRKPTDSQKLAIALKDLGFTVSEQTARNLHETNCIWYGSAVDANDVKLVAYAIIRAGLDLRGIQPQSNPSAESHTIQVGHNPRLEDAPPFSVELINKTPVRQLQRREAEAKANVAGTIKKFDLSRHEGLIRGPEGDVYFRVDPGQAFHIGDPVTFMMYYGKKMYAQDVKPLASPTTPQPLP